MIHLKTNHIILLVLTITGCQSNTPEPMNQIYMQTEDSHPHEIQPGESRRFPFWKSNVPGYIDVKCSFSGSSVPFAIGFSGIDTKAWVLDNKQVHLSDATFYADIEGIVTDTNSNDIYLEFTNKSPTELLWHQCYNN